jgi:acyl-CoA synthetase (AMP-forming)/AMP-acid ligase II
MNIVHNCLDKRIGTPKEHAPAIRWSREEGATGALTYGELTQRVNRAAGALRTLGFSKGDVIGVCMPMIPEIAVAFFAVIKIGAIVLPLFSGYGADAIATRLADSGARGLITADGARRRGRTVLMKPVADEAVRHVPSIHHVIVVPRVGENVPMQRGRDVWWDEVVRAEPPESPTERTSAEDPFMLIYTSGTTGKPKGAVHTHCGFPIKAAQDLQHGFDMGAQDTMFWVTDLGWMMGPWELLGTAVIGATAVLYDGALDYPTCNRVWSLVDEHRVSILGISPTLVRMMMHADDAAPEAHDLSSLRMFGSTGEPWNPDPWLWLFERVGKRRLPIINYSGGTEISGGIISGADEAVCVRGTAAGDGCRRCRCGGTSTPQRGWRARHTRAVDRDVPRLLERSGALPAHLLVPISKRVGTRRLGPCRRRRPVVHLRPLRRHAEDCGQTYRPRRNRVGTRLASGRCRSSGGRVARRHQRRASDVRVRAQPRHSGHVGVGTGIKGSREERNGAGIEAGRDPIRHAAAQDAQRQGHASPHSRRVLWRRSW